MIVSVNIVGSGASPPPVVEHTTHPSRPTADVIRSVLLLVNPRERDVDPVRVDLHAKLVYRRFVGGRV